MPIFNTLFHSEKLSSELSHMVLMSALMLDELHHSGKITKEHLPRDFDAAYILLQTKSRHPSRFHKLSRWDDLFNNFINQAMEYLSMPGEVVHTPSTLVYQIQFTTPKKKIINLEASKEILTQCLWLLYYIKSNRLGWKQKLATYLLAINAYITEKMSASLELQSKLNKTTNPDMQYALSPSGRPATTVFKGKQVVGDLQKKLPKMASIDRAHAFGVIMQQEQVTQMYEPAMVKVSEQLALDEGTYSWLREFIKNFPTALFTLTNCLQIQFSQVAEQTLVIKHSAEASGGAPLRAHEPMNITTAPWLYASANIHLVSEDRIAEYDALYQQFNLVSASTPMRIILDQFTIIFSGKNEQIAGLFHELKAKAGQTLEVIKKSKRPLSFTETTFVKRADDNWSIFLAAYDFMGATKLRGWLNTIVAFKHFKLNLSSQLLHYVTGLREKLRSLLIVDSVSLSPFEALDPNKIYIDFRNNGWLERLLKPLYGYDTEFVLVHDDKETTPVNRMHLIKPLEEVVKQSVSLYNAAHVLANLDVPAELNSLAGQKRIYDFLVKATNGIKYGYLLAIDSTAIDKTRYPLLQPDKIFSPQIQNIMLALEDRGGIAAALENLSKANQTATEANRVKDLHQSCCFFRDINGKISGSVTEILLEIGALAKDYLPTLCPDR